MAQIINDPYGSRSSGLGAILGQGLGTGLSQVVQHKIDTMLQNQQQSRLANILAKTGNFSPEQAKVISMFQGNPAVAHKMMELFGHEAQQEAQQQQSPARQPIVQQAARQQEIRQKSEPIILSNLTQPNSQTSQIRENVSQVLKSPTKPQQIEKILGTLTPEEVRQPLPVEEMSIPKVTEKEPPRKLIDKTRRQFGETPKMALDRQKFEEAQKMHGAVRKETAFKMTQKYRDEVEKLASSARENANHYSAMQRLNKQDKLINPMLYSALKTAHLDFPWLIGQEAQEYEKEKAGLLRDAKSIFGARVTNFEMSQFLKMIPTLENTKEGRTTILKNLNLANKAALLREKAMRDIIRENKGTPPLDIHEQVEDRIGGQLDKISHMFATGENLPDFDAMPPAQQYVGKTIKDNATGKIFKSNGQEWVGV